MRTKRGEGQNKFLPPFDRKKAEKLHSILIQLIGSPYSFRRVISALEDILHRPSCIRKCDVVLQKEIFDAIEKL